MTGGIGQAAADAAGGAPPPPGQAQQTGSQPPGGQPPQPGGQGLPPTGIQQQLSSLNDYYGQVQGAQSQNGGIGFDPREMAFNQSQGGGMGVPGDQQTGGNSLDAMARRLARSYGLPIGRGQMVDSAGNLIFNAEELAQASGGQETLGTATTKLQYIENALTEEQNRQQQQKGINAIQAGMGMTMNRGRGSLATMQSGMYQDLADLYSNQQYEAADFSFWIQKEQQDIQNELRRKAEKKAKKSARIKFVTGLVGGIASFGTGGILGGISSAAGGQGGFQDALGSAADTGWF